MPHACGAGATEPPSGVAFDLGEVAGERLAGAVDLVRPAGYALPPRGASDDEVEAAERDATEWAIAVGLIDHADRYRAKFSLSRLGALAACTLPDVPPSRARLFVRLQAFIFTLDDALDNLIDIRTDRCLDHVAARRVTAALHAALAGDCVDLRDAEAAARLMPRFAGFERAMHELGRMAAITASSAAAARWFVDSMEQYLAAVAWEHSAFAAEGAARAAAVYMFDREQTISYLQSIESFLLIKGIRLGAAQRRLHAVRLLLAMACRHVILVNDIFSLAKEIRCEEQANALLLEPLGSAALRTRFDALLAELNALARELAQIATALRDEHADDAAVTGFVDTVVNSANGHIAWYAESLRYGALRKAPVIPGLSARSVAAECEAPLAAY